MSGVIATIPKFQFSANGAPMVNGTLETYLAGTSTPATTWQDQALSIANTNPITLDSRGECVLWLDSTKAYKFILKNAGGVTQWTQDNISGADNGLRDALAAPSGASLVTYTPAGTGAVATTVQDKLRQSVSILDFYANGVSGARVDPTGVIDSTAGIQAAFNASKSVYIPKGTYKCSSNINLSASSDTVSTEGFHIYGDGRESKLTFSSGGLVLSGVAAKNAVLEQFHIEVTGTGQIALDLADVNVNKAPTRWVLRDMWVRGNSFNANTGVRIRGGWIASIFNIIVQSLDTGISIVKSADVSAVSFNGLSFFGGEIQGNKTGIYAESVLGLNFFGTAIEGNRNNGVRLYDGCRNVTFDAVYFEGNGVDLPATTSDVRIQVSTGLSTLHAVMFHNCSFLSAGGAQDAIWVNKCGGLVVDEGCSFNGYTNRLNIQDIAAGVTTGNFRAIAPSTAISWTNNSNAFGAATPHKFTMGGLSMPDATTTVAPDIVFLLPSNASKLGDISIAYTAAATGDVFFRITPYDIATGSAAANLDVIATAVVGRNLATSTFNFDSRSLRGKNIALAVSRLGSSGSDTNTGAITLSVVTVTVYQ